MAEIKPAEVSAILKKQLAGVDLGVELEIDFVVKGAHTLKKFANASDEKGKIVDELLRSNDDYDYVILQEHSTTPANDYNSFKNMRTPYSNNWQKIFNKFLHKNQKYYYKHQHLQNYFRKGGKYIILWYLASFLRVL